MKLALAATLLYSSIASSHAQASCFGSTNFGFKVENGECSSDEFLEALQVKIDNKASCSNTAEEELIALTGEANIDDARAVIDDLCVDTWENQNEADMAFTFGRNERTLEEYFDGGTEANWQVQYTNDDGDEVWVLKDDFGRISSQYDGPAQNGKIGYPDEMKNFEDCEYRAAYCCWIQDRQANDNNGDCAEPYDENCVDADPGDNTDLCYVDMSDAPQSAHVAEGIAVFPDDTEGAIHCHGFAWGNDEAASDARYRGNNLFYVSLYDHFYTRGYVRNVPGAPMCGCAEQMPVVSRADCTEMTINETYRYLYRGANGSGFSVKLRNASIEYNACEGANNNNNDLEAYYERLVDEGRADAGELEALQDKLVGDCVGAIEAIVG